MPRSHEQAARAGNALRALGLEIEQRVAMCMLDGRDFPTVFWGAIQAGAVPVPLNTLLTSRTTRSCSPTAARASSWSATR